jgi:hypothetical protein
MKLKNYFENASGTGVMATADSEGVVDAAIYSSPHVAEDGTVAFVMRDHLTHHNLQSNPHAAYLFREQAPGYQGVRLFLKRLREETDSTLIASMTRRHLTPEEDLNKGPKFLVYFRVEKILPLIGSGDTNLKLA